MREINKVFRTMKSQYVDARFWPLKGNQRILGFPDASYRNNSDKSSQRAHVIYLAEEGSHTTLDIPRRRIAQLHVDLL